METPLYAQHTVEELVKAYVEVKGDAEFVDYFIVQYNQAFDDYIGNEDEEGTPTERALHFCFEFYMPVFLEQLHKGHSAKWAHEFAFSCEEEDSIIYNNYHDIKKIDPLWAQNELIIHCKSLGITDPMQVNYYINLIDVGHRSPAGGIEKSGMYMETFKRELARGKSFLYSHTYAKELISDENNHVYSEAYAWAFELCIQKNRSENFIYTFVHEFANVIEEKFDCLDEAMNDEDFSFFINPIIAEAQAIDYIKTHEVENPEKFISVYKDIFTDFNHLDPSPLLQINDDIDEEVLKLTLKKMGN
nr:hypothetical protein [uncultured Flavobacterium sp.]